MYCLFFRTPGILAMIFLLLFLAGDVELNPGPPKYGELIFNTTVLTVLPD